LGHYGFLSLIPSLVTLVLAIATKRTVESVIIGATIGHIILMGSGFFTGIINSLLTVMADPTIGWIIVVCGLFGGFVALLQSSGGSEAFGNWIKTFAKTRKQSLIITWLLGLAIFVDDYLNALTVGTCMQRVTDEHRVSREMLAYIVDSTASPVCILVPFSTWAVFVAGLLESNGAAAAGEGMKAYIASIPYMFYSIVAVLIVPLMILGVVPLFGPMKKAEKRAMETGVVAPPGSDKLAAMGGNVALASNAKPKISSFVIPLAVLIAVTWLTDVDMLKGVIVALIVQIIMYVGQRFMTLSEVVDVFFEGLKSMIFALTLLVLAFVLKEANDQLGLAAYVIETVTPYMSAGLLPAVTFVSLSFIAFSAALFWALYAMALPIVIPLALATGASIPLTVAAVVCAGAFGSHACFFCDSTILSSMGSGCNNIDHCLTQLPYSLVTAGISVVLFVVAGVVMA
jgi:tetracycline resistance efflux pump